MAKDTLKTTDNPKLKRKSIMKGKMQSLYLDYYLGKCTTTDNETGTTKEATNRKRRFLGLHIYTNPTTPTERTHNDETIIQAEIMRENARKEYLNGKGFAFEVEKKVNIEFWGWLNGYKMKYSKADYRVINSAIFGFREYLKGNSKYKGLLDNMNPAEITHDMCEGFAEYLMKTHKGEGAVTYWQRFNKVMKAAVKDGALKENPCTDIQVSANDNRMEKETLTEEEVEMLMQTNNEALNQDVKRAFLFCIYTGLRWCDVKTLAWQNIDTERKQLDFVQNKVKHSSKRARVIQPLRDDVLLLLGEPNEKDCKVFPQLPTSSNGANYSLADWAKCAGITKHITWHCARHTFCTYALHYTKDINAVSAMAGHSSYQITANRYAHVLQDEKLNVANSFQPIVLNGEKRTTETPKTKPQQIDISGLTTEQFAVITQLISTFNRQ